MKLTRRKKQAVEAFLKRCPGWVREARKHFRSTKFYEGRPVLQGEIGCVTIVRVYESSNQTLTRG